MSCSVSGIQERNGSCWMLKHLRIAEPCIWKPSGKAEVDQRNYHRNWEPSAFGQGGFCAWLPLWLPQEMISFGWVVTDNSSVTEQLGAVSVWSLRVGQHLIAVGFLVVTLHSSVQCALGATPSFPHCIPLAGEDGAFLKHPVWDDPASLPFSLVLLGTDPWEKEHHGALSIPYYIWMVGEQGWGCLIQTGAGFCSFC